MNGKLLLAVVQILIGIVLCCTALLKPAQPKTDPTQSVQPEAVPTSTPYAPVIAGSGLFAATKGLWDLYKILFDEDEGETEEDFQQHPLPRQYAHYERAAPYYNARTQSVQNQHEQYEPADKKSSPVRQPVYEYQPVGIDVDIEKGSAFYEQTEQQELIETQASLPDIASYLAETQDEPQIPEEFFLPLRNTLARAETSWVLCGAPGVGKTTFLLAWMADCISFNPGVQFFINGWKNDEWLGLAKIRGVYKRNCRTERSQINFNGFFEQVSRVADILHARLELPAKEREDLKKNRRIWLVLDDYFATSDALNKIKGEVAAKWETAKAELGQIITLGREVGVALCAATHSLNIKALGVEDSNVRGCLSLCALCKVFVNELGRREGGYEAISNALRNPYIIPPEYANTIASILGQLRALSESNNCAIALTTFGTPMLGLVEEDLSWVADYQVSILEKKATSELESDSPAAVETSKNPSSSKLIPFRLPEPWEDADGA